MKLYYIIPLNYRTARRVSKYGVISGPYFSVFGLNTEIYGVNLRIQFEYRKYGPETTPYLDTFHTVSLTEHLEMFKIKLYYFQERLYLLYNIILNLLA